MVENAGCETSLKKLHKEKFGKAHDKVVQLRNKLEEIYCQSDSYYDDVVQVREKEYLADLRYWSKIEDSILRQKSRINWLKLGDANTKLFLLLLNLDTLEIEINISLTMTADLLLMPRVLKMKL